MHNLGLTPSRLERAVLTGILSEMADEAALGVSSSEASTTTCRRYPEEVEVSTLILVIPD